MIVSSSAEVLKRARELREFSKMTDMQAAMGRVQLRRLPGFLARRGVLAARYDRALIGLNIDLPHRDEGRIYQRYVIRVPGANLDALIKALERHGVAARRPVYRPLHQDVPCRGAFPQAQAAWQSCLSLPLYPALTDREQAKVIAAVRGVLAREGP